MFWKGPLTTNLFCFVLFFIIRYIYPESGKCSDFNITSKNLRQVAYLFLKVTGPLFVKNRAKDSEFNQR
jgi:hypothetical protein